MVRWMALSATPCRAKSACRASNSDLGRLGTCEPLPSAAALKMQLASRGS
jgi:hypothetical protein